MKKKNHFFSALLVATTAIGPGFLTQTAEFTSQFGGLMGIIIMITLFLALLAQLCIWTILGTHKKHVQDFANELLPGLGYVLAFLICAGGLLFNIGNVGGGALGLYTLFHIPTRLGALVTGVLAIAIFSAKNIQKAMDIVTSILSAAMIIVLVIMIFIIRTPVTTAFQLSRILEFDAKEIIHAIITLLGGTIGGYITFSGIHRLLDAGVEEETVSSIQKSAAIGIGLNAIIRYTLYFALYGIVVQGYLLNETNPIVDAFEKGAGKIGYYFAGVVLLGTSLIPVMGAAYTSVSFIKTFHPWIEEHEIQITKCFIAISTIIMCTLGKPARLLVFAGTINGYILPIALLVCLAGYFKDRRNMNKNRDGEI